MRAKTTMFFTTIPCGLFILASQTEYRQKVDECLAQKAEIASLKADLEWWEANNDSANRLESVRLLEEAQKIWSKSKKELDESYVMAKRNNEFRNGLLNNLRRETNDVKKFVKAYKETSSAFVIGLFVENYSSKKTELEKAIHEVQKLPIGILEQDTELKNALEDALLTNKYLKNSFWNHPPTSLWGWFQSVGKILIFFRK